MKDIFCRIVSGEIPSTKLYEDDDVLVILDISQATKGHALVMPKAHYESILDCPEEILKKVYVVAQKIAKAEMKAFSASGVNVLTNALEAAGQSVPHFHVHVIPRYDETDGFNTTFVAHEPDFEALKAIAERIKDSIHV